VVLTSTNQFGTYIGRTVFIVHIQDFFTVSSAYMILSAAYVTIYLLFRPIVESVEKS